MKKRSIVLLLFLLCILSSTVNGQFQYKKGIVITSKNEKREGLILDRGDLLNSKAILFRPDRKSSSIRYTPGEIRSFRFDQGREYKAGRYSVGGYSSPLFAEVLVQGKISLLHSLGSRATAYYMQKENGKLVGLMNVENQNKLQVSTEGKSPAFPFMIELFKDSLASLFAESSISWQQVDELHYNHKDLMKITVAYLKETCREENCIPYKKDMNPSRVKLGVLGGLRMVQLSSYETNEGLHPLTSSVLPSYTAGVFCNIPLNYFVNQLSLQAEVMASVLSSRPGDVQVDNADFLFDAAVIGVPLSLRYRILPGRWSPVAFAGKETSFVLKSGEQDQASEKPSFHRTQAGGWFFGTGIDFRMNKMVSVFADLRLLSWKNLLVDERSGDKWGFRNYKDYNYTLIRSNAAAMVVGIQF